MSKEDVNEQIRVQNKRERKRLEMEKKLEDLHKEVKTDSGEDPEYYYSEDTPN